MSNPSTNDNFGDVQQSFQRCVTRQGFLQRFYDIFMASHPDVRPMFEKTDFTQQLALLRHGLSASIAFAGGTRLGANVLNRIGSTHGRERMNINPALYPYWINSLMQAVSETDPKFNPQLDLRWRRAMEIATGHIRGMH